MRTLYCDDSVIVNEDIAQNEEKLDLKLNFLCIFEFYSNEALHA